MSESKVGASAPETDPRARGPDGMYGHESGSPGSPAIVFVHGMGQSGPIWREHMARLSGFHCLPPTFRGSGDATTCRRPR